MKKKRNPKKTSKDANFFKGVRPKTEAVFIAFVMMTLIFFSTYLVHIKSMASLVEEIKIGLNSNVSSAATTINGDLHQEFTAETERDDSLYLSQIAPLEQIRQNAKDIRYIYTNILVDDKVYFVMNPSPQNDNDGNGEPDLAPALMEEYVNPAPELVAALKEQKSTVSDAYTDQWGIFISAYAPFYDSQGNFVGTLGMDLELNNFYERLKPIEIAFEKTVVIIIFLGLVIGLLIWYIRKYTLVLLKDQRVNQNKEAAHQLAVEKIYQENALILEKTNHTLTSLVSEKTSKFNQFKYWIKNAKTYMRSHVPNVVPILEPFTVNELLEGIKEQFTSNNQKLHLDIEKNLPKQLSGVPADLYREHLCTLLQFISDNSKGEMLKLNACLHDEGINDVILEITLSGFNAVNFEARYLRQWQAETNIYPRPNDKPYQVATAINILKQYDYQTKVFSTQTSAGFKVYIKLKKQAEN